MKPKKSTEEKSQPSPSKSSSPHFNVVTTTLFKKEAKRLKKRYPKILIDLENLNETLETDPFTGNKSLGKNCFKIRMNITDKKAGKQGGARVIVNVEVKDETVYLLSIYDKSEKSSISDELLDYYLANKLNKE